MAKVLISLSVPVIGEKYDMFVPDDVVIESLTKIVAQGVFDICGGKYLISGSEMLMKLNPEELLNPQKRLKDYGVLDGEHMMMI
ncbi:MAG: hypothetical protein MJ105_00940 [Lachnospiraceae bacterium]|nr:hypothetical protein [Lachnospiraceae bacterium]